VTKVFVSCSKLVIRGCP